MRPLLVLRPEPGASATVARAKAAGLEAVRAPLFTIAAVPWEVPAGDHDALMLTSANAVRHAGPGLEALRGLPAFAVGGATAAAARAVGLDARAVGQTDAAALLTIMAEHGVQAALHLAGREHRLGADPVLHVTTRIVYRADAVEALPGEAVEALAAGAIALIHSPRAAAVFAALCDRQDCSRALIDIAAISAAAAAAAGAGWRAVAAAAAPHDDALLAAVAALCEREPR